MKNKGPKILMLDIETSPIEVLIWRLGKQIVTIDQIIKDWSVLSWAAKWKGEDKVMYEDTRNKSDVRDDKSILKKLWKLLNESDIILTQNGKKFDNRMIKARLAFHKMPPPSSYRHIDLLEISNQFGFTSKKLAFLSDKLNTYYKKLKHKKFPGLELWKQCLVKNAEAFKEMEQYNKYDVLSTEELHALLSPWDPKINFNVYYDDVTNKCSGCGQESFKSMKKCVYTNSAKYRRYRCTNCGSETRSKVNLFSKDKIKSLKPLIK